MNELVNVNDVDAATLDTIDAVQGHGFEIVRYREERGRFISLRQLGEVPGLAGVLDDTALAKLTIGKAVV